jgi:hypothetical protein
MRSKKKAGVPFIHAQPFLPLVYYLNKNGLATCYTGIFSIAMAPRNISLVNCSEILEQSVGD